MNDRKKRRSESFYDFTDEESNDANITLSSSSPSSWPSQTVFSIIQTIEAIAKKCGVKDQEIELWNLCEEFSKNEKIKKGRRIIMAIITKVVAALALVLGLEETELFIHSEHDIDQILNAFGLAELNVAKENSSNKILLCRKALQQANFVLAHKICKKANIAMEDLKTHQQFSAALEDKLQEVDYLAKGKKIPGRVAIVEKSVKLILDMCLEYFNKALVLEKPLAYFYLNIILEMLQIPPADLQSMKTSDRKLGHFKRVVNSTVQKIGTLFGEKFNLTRADFKSYINISSHLFTSKSFKKFCDTILASLKNITINSHSNYLSSLLKKAGITQDLDSKASCGDISVHECSENIDDHSLVRNMYLSDEYSIMLPGVKQFQKVYQEGKKVSVQKKVLLVTVGELFSMFKEKYPEATVGRSKFYYLRPSWVIPEENCQVENNCLCTICQNLKLLTYVIKSKPYYGDLLEHGVCNSNSTYCMQGFCPDCPGEVNLKPVLRLYMKNQLVVKFQQWSRTQGETGMQLKFEELEQEEFIRKLSTDLLANKRHIMLKKTQIQYLKNLKAFLPQSQIIMIMDFSQNFAFICQDAVQGFFWSNKQATVHPFAVYYKDSQDKLQTISYCVISDCKTHDVSCVHAFTSKVVKDVRRRLPNISHINYFSDGAGGQYKNIKNMVNLVEHSNDFGLTAEWNFSPTGHGKSVPDGIGGAIKRAVKRESLRRKEGMAPIQTAKEMVEYLQSRKDSKIEVFYVSNIEIIEHSKKFNFEDRFSEKNLKKYRKSVKGIKLNHRFTAANGEIRGQAFSSR